MEKPLKVFQIVLSTQHDEDISHQEIKDQVLEHIIEPVVPKNWITPKPKSL